jgi:hypothetical protein
MVIAVSNITILNLLSSTCLNQLQPYGFDVGNSERGNVLKGLDLGVEGMKVGGQVSNCYGFVLVLLFKLSFQMNSSVTL